jgi:hypothetical protein
MTAHGQADLRVLLLSGAGPSARAVASRTFASKGEALPDYPRETTTADSREGLAAVPERRTTTLTGR